MSNQLEIWSPIGEAKLPANAIKPDIIIPYAHSLTDNQKNQVIKAMEVGSYDMATEFVWKKSMMRLRSILSKLGHQFVGEMIGRPEFDEFTNIDQVLTDYTAIQLAEQLNIISKTAALKLKYGLELVNHYFSDTAVEENEEFQLEECISIIKSCVTYLLSEKNISIATEFSEFRERLLKSPIPDDDQQLEAIYNSSVFFIRTSLVILINAIKDHSNPAKKETALANINIILAPVWSKIREEEKFLVGMAYRDVVSSGDQMATNGLRKALLTVKGFDYVPESLRSNTFIQAAKNLIDAHFNFNNFYNEPGLVQKLANLGTSIPAPAFGDCIKAFMYVYLGNRYGVSNEAQPLILEQLRAVTKNRWEYFFDEIFFKDEQMLYKLTDSRPAARFIDAFNSGIIPFELNLQDPKQFIFLIDAVKSGNIATLNKFMQRQLDRL